MGLLTAEKDRESVEWAERNETARVEMERVETEQVESGKGAFGLTDGWEQFVEDLEVLMDVKGLHPVVGHFLISYG